MFYRENIEGFEHLIKDNYDYYVEYINNRCFVFVVGNKKLLTIVEPRNLKHLLGINHTTENFFFKKLRKKFSTLSVMGK